jgi:formylglycine-generating enzyme required for sulfatase activity
MNDDARHKRLAQLRQAFESGLLDEDTYQAAVAGIEAEPRTEANLEGDGARALGRGSLAAGKDARVIQGDHNVMGDHSRSVEAKTYIEHQTLSGETPTDPDALRAGYLSHLYTKVRRIALSGIDPEAASKAEARLNLGAVYTALRTLTREECDHLNRERCLPEQMTRGERHLSALAQLDRHQRLVLLGEPGSGKSTFVNFVTLCLAGVHLGEEPNLAHLREPLPAADEEKDDEQEPQPWSHGALLPVRVVLRDFAARGLPPVGERATAKHLWDFIAAELEEAALGDYASHLAQHLQRDGGLILLDGLDEVPEPQRRREQIKQAVEDFAGTFRKCRFLVTSRTYAYQKQAWRLDSFQETVLAPFDQGQIRRFVKRWYAHIAQLRDLSSDEVQGRAALLQRAIVNSERLQALAERPLLLTLMASLHAWRGGSLPEKREALYADTVDLLLDWWERPKAVRDGKGNYVVRQPSLAEWLRVDREKVRDLLERLAYEAHAAQPELLGTADVPEGQLLGGLMRLSQNPEANPAQLVRYLSQRAGLLVTRGVSVYTFPHRTFQEYLAACHLTDFDYPDEVAELARADPNRWREVALLAGAKAARGTTSAVWSLVEALCYRDLAVDEPQPKPDAWGALLAGQALVESADLEQVSERNKAKVKRIKTHLVHVMREGQLPAMERVAAGRALAKLGDPRPHVAKVDRMHFCYVPPGPFWMGCEEFDNARPQHLNRCLDVAYWIARYPVTVAQFRMFLEADGYQPKITHDLDELPNHPVVNITWHDARAFCMWLTEHWRTKGWLLKDWHVRLPTESEWEKAARGGLKIPRKPLLTGPQDFKEIQGEIAMTQNPSPQQKYPWGDESDPEKANYDDTSIGRTSTVGCFTAGGSPYGVEELSGNVWEWTGSLWGKDVFDPEFRYPYSSDHEYGKSEAGDDVRRVLRGGSFDDFSGFVRCSYRYGNFPRYNSKDYGFRVVVSCV